VLWTAGVEAPPFAEALAKATGAERDRAGRIIARDDLTIKDHAEISVIGDMMSLRKLPASPRSPCRPASTPAAGSSTRQPARAHRAHSGTTTSDRPRIHPAAAPSYRPGRSSSLAARGWVVWLFIHIAFLTGYRNRIGAILTWWVAFTREVRRPQ
jgi:NADH dehydrogenase